MNTTHSAADTENRSDAHQQAREACQHALDALSNGVSRGRSLLDEARAPVERAEHDDTDQPPPRNGMGLL